MRGWGRRGEEVWGGEVDEVGAEGWGGEVDEVWAEG